MPHLDLTIPVQLAAIADAQEAFRAFAKQHALDARCRRTVHLALDELLTNIVTYAFDADSPRPPITARITLHADRLEVTLTDAGRPFDPFAQPSPVADVPLEERELGGLGIELVRRLMDEATWAREDARNVVRLVHASPWGATDRRDRP